MRAAIDGEKEEAEKLIHTKKSSLSFLIWAHGITYSFIFWVGAMAPTANDGVTNDNMDAKAKNKALFRAKLNAQKKEKRINSPLIRYKDSDQPVCKICDCVLRSESVWDAHQLSRNISLS
ncbi:hypothetical protein ACLB2K_031059 [Fragaria x ananassa]